MYNENKYIQFDGYWLIPFFIHIHHSFTWGFVPQGVCNKCVSVLSISLSAGKVIDIRVGRYMTQDIHVYVNWLASWDLKDRAQWEKGHMIKATDMMSNIHIAGILYASYKINSIKWFTGIKIFKSFTI